MIVGVGVAGVGGGKVVGVAGVKTEKVVGVTVEVGTGAQRAAMNEANVTPNCFMN
jgi:hypothetical protein